MFQLHHIHCHRSAPGRARMAAGALTLSLALSLALGACTLGGSDGDGEDTGTDAGQTGNADGTEDGDGTEDADATDGGTADETGEVVLVTHESFAAPEEVLEQFAAETGHTVTVQPTGDAGGVTNRLVLTQSSPLGDVVFGVDNTFASRAVNEGVLAEYTPEQLPDGVEEHALPGDGAQYLTPIDYGDVCVNIDDVWFAENEVEPPQTLEDLTEPAYEDLFVTPGATTSSPGMAFLLATIAEFGQGEDGWQQYWTELMDNGTRVTSGWSDAYSVDFTAGGGDGDRPIVLSYASSPPYTVPEGGDEPTTSALLDTCLRQVEYAGVIEGAANPEGARALVDFLVSTDFQSTIAENMFVYPVNDEVELPEDWSRWAEVAEDPHTIDPAEVEDNREEWLRTWGEITTR